MRFFLKRNSSLRKYNVNFLLSGVQFLLSGVQFLLSGVQFLRSGIPVFPFLFEEKFKEFWGGGVSGRLFYIILCESLRHIDGCVLGSFR